MDSLNMNKAHIEQTKLQQNDVPYKGTSTSEGFVPSPPTSQPPSAGIHLRPELHQSEGFVPSSSLQEPLLTGLHPSSELAANPAKNTLKDDFQTSGSTWTGDSLSTGSALEGKGTEQGLGEKLSDKMSGMTIEGKGTEKGLGEKISEKVSGMTSGLTSGLTSGTTSSKGTSIKSATDVVHFLKDQHNLIETMFEKVLSAPSKETRQTAFTDLRRLLAVHEAAEEIVVHPRARKVVGDTVVDARLKEEAEAKMKLVKLESMDIDSREFIDELRIFSEAVKTHAKNEEREEFEYLLREVDSKELQRMTRSVEIAESLAPTRPHPMTGEGPTLNLMVGPFASMVDRARDAFNL